MVFLMLLIFAALSLKRTLIFISGGVALIFQAVWQILAGANLPTVAWSSLAIGSSAAALLYACDRMCLLVANAAHQQAERQRLKRYFSPQVVEHLEAKGLNHGGGEKREITVLFADLRGFSTLAHSLGDEEVVDLLNSHHSSMVEVLFDHLGTLDKFLGDV